MAAQFPPMTDFAVAFAAEYKGFMKAHDITGAQVADVLGRGEGYVSERINGKRALDTNDVAALAELAGAWDGLSLMIELSRRAERNVGGRREDYDLVANDTIDEHPEDTDADFDNA